MNDEWGSDEHPRSNVQRVVASAAEAAFEVGDDERGPPEGLGAFALEDVEGGGGDGGDATQFEEVVEADAGGGGFAEGDVHVVETRRADHDEGEEEEGAEQGGEVAAEGG